MGRAAQARLDLVVREGGEAVEGGEAEYHLAHHMGAYRAVMKGEGRPAHRGVRLTLCYAMPCHAML